MKVAILQPTYWARAHVWNRVLDCDAFVWLDHVKFSRSSTKWEDRTIIEGRDGRSIVLRLPLKGSRNATWREAGLNEGWQRQEKTIEQCYSRSPQWGTVKKLVASVYSDDADTIDEVCWRSFTTVHDFLGASCTIVRSHALGIDASKGQLVLDIVKALGGTEYISGAPGLDYLPLDDFARADVTVNVQDWSAPVTVGGLANPSVLHILANHNVDEATALLGPVMPGRSA